MSSSSWAQLPRKCSRVLPLEDHSLKLRVLSSTTQAQLGCSWMHYPPSGSRLRLGCLLHLLGAGLISREGVLAIPRFGLVLLVRTPSLDLDWRSRCGASPLCTSAWLLVCVCSHPLVCVVMTWTGGGHQTKPRIRSRSVSRPGFCQYDGPCEHCYDPGIELHCLTPRLPICDCLTSRVFSRCCEPTVVGLFWMCSSEPGVRPS